MKNFFKVVINIPKYLLLGIFYIFRFCISPFIPHTCKFTPTCSVYASESTKEWGFFVGIFLTAKRLLKCNPFTKGGLDPVPYNIKGYYKNLM